MVPTGDAPYGREVLAAGTVNLRPSPLDRLSGQDPTHHRAYRIHFPSSANDGFFPYISIPTR